MKKFKYGNCWGYPIPKIRELVNGFISSSRTINGKALDQDIVLTADDIPGGKEIIISDQFTSDLTGGGKLIVAFYNPFTKFVHGSFYAYNHNETLTMTTPIFKCTNDAYKPDTTISYCGLFSTAANPTVMIPNFGKIDTSGNIIQNFASTCKNCFGIFAYPVTE